MSHARLVLFLPTTDPELELCELSLFWQKIKENKKTKTVTFAGLPWGSVKELPLHSQDPRLSPVTSNCLLGQPTPSLQGKPLASEIVWMGL